MTLALWLLAAHLVGDYVLQTRWQSVEKFGGWRNPARARHVASYCAPFVPIAAWYTADWEGRPWDGLGRPVAFLVLLALLHYLTDWRRYSSTIGDVIAWRFFLSQADRDRNVKVHLDLHAVQDVPRNWRNRRPPSPWGPLPIMLDQTAHIVQIAVLAALFLA